MVLNIVFQEAVDSSLQIIHDIATENLGSLCVSRVFRPLQIALNTERYEGARQKADLAAVVLQEVGVNRHGGKSFLRKVNLVGKRLYRKIKNFISVPIKKN